MYFREKGMKDVIEELNKINAQLEEYFLEDESNNQEGFNRLVPDAIQIHYNDLQKEIGEVYTQQSITQLNNFKNKLNNK